MGRIHYSERQYYDDPDENAEFIRVYGSQLYCKHNQPNYYKCYWCRDEKEEIKMKNYWERMNIKYKNFNWDKFFKNSGCYFGMESPDPDNPINEDEDFKLMGLKRTSSQEDLKKAFRKQCLTTHPDKVGGDGTAFKRMKQAYDNIKMNYF